MLNVSNATPPQPNHTVTPTHIEPERYTHTQLQAPEDECTSIRNMLSKKIKQVTSVGLSLFNYQDDARSDKHKIRKCI